MAGTQWLLFRGATMSAASTMYFPPMGGENASAGSTSEADISCPCPAGGTITKIIVNLSAAPGAAKSYRFQASVAGAASTQVDVTITGAASTTGTASGTGVAVTAGNTLSVKVTPTGTPTVANADIWLEWTPTTVDQFIYMGGILDNLGAAPRFIAALAGYAYVNAATVATDTVHGRSICPIAGSISALYVRMATAPGAGKSWDMLLNVNTVESATSAINVAEGATTGNATGLAIAIAINDTISYKIKAANGAPSATYGHAWGICFTPTVPGRFCIGTTNDGDAQSAAAVRYGHIGYHTSAIEVWDDVEADVQLVVGPPTMRVAGFSTEITTVAGAAKSHTQHFRVGGTSPGMSLVFNDGATTKTAATGNAIPLVAGNLINISNTPASTPALSGITNWTIAFEQTPPAGGPGNSGNAPGRGRGNPNPGGGGGNAGGGGNGGGTGGGALLQKAFWGRRRRTR